MHGPDSTVKLTQKGKIEMDFYHEQQNNLAILNSVSQWYHKTDFVKFPFLEKLRKAGEKYFWYDAKMKLQDLKW